MAARGYISRSRMKTQARRLRQNLSGRYETKPRTWAAGVVSASLVQIAGALVPASGLEDARGTVLVKNAGRPAAVQYTTEAGGSSVINLAGGVGGGGGGGSLVAHGLDSVYHTGTLAWDSVNKTGSRLADLAARAHSDLTDILPDQHHDPVTVGNTGLSLDAQEVSLNLAADAGLLIDAGLKVNHGQALAIYSNILFVDLATNSGMTLGQGAFSASALALGEPSDLSVSSANGVSGTTHVHRIISSSNPAGWNPEAASGLRSALLRTDSAGLLQLKTLASNAPFFSGFAGSGYRLDYGITEDGKASAEFDNLTVRGRMRVYELLIQQIRATNGSVFVTSSSKAETVSELDNGWYVVTVTYSSWEVETENGIENFEFETIYGIEDARLDLGAGVTTERLQFDLGDDNYDASFDTKIYLIDTRNEDADQDQRHQYHGFLEGDAIRAQEVEWDPVTKKFTGVRLTNLVVTGVMSLWEYQGVPTGEFDVPEAGDEFVRLGSMDPTRRGTVYLTSDDSNAPFIDVVDGVRTHADWNTPGKVRVRLGKLTGITDGDFGTLEGYGLYGDNVYLKGKIVISGGSSGYENLTDVPPYLETPPPDGQGLYLDSTHMGYYAGNDWRTYMDNLGNFKLGDHVNGQGLYWDQAASTLTIAGSISVTGITGLGALATKDKASWTDDVSSRPAELTDGRVATGFDANGNVKTKVLPGSPIGTPATEGLYLGSDVMGYYYGGWKSYIKNDGTFGFIGDVNNSVVWDGSALAIRGRATISGGEPVGTPSASGLYMGSDRIGYYDSLHGWTTYITNNGSFFAGRFGVGYPRISWDAATGNLDIQGKITVLGTGSNVIEKGGAAADINDNTTTIDGGKITANSITATTIASGAVTASKISVDGSIVFSTNGGAIRSGKTSFADMANAGWWIGMDSSLPKFHFGKSNSYIAWDGYNLVVNQPNLKGQWVTVGSGGLSYGTGWGTYGYSNDMRYVLVGDFVWVMGWVRANNTSNNAIIATGLPAPAQSFYTGVRSSRPPTPYESSQPNSSGDVVYVENNSGSGRLVFFGYLSLPDNSYNIDLILNFVYRAA